VAPEPAWPAILQGSAYNAGVTPNGLEGLALQGCQSAFKFERRLTRENSSKRRSKAAHRAAREGPPADGNRRKIVTLPMNRERLAITKSVRRLTCRGDQNARGPPTTVREAALKQRLVGLLRSPLVQKIDFFIGYMHINGVGYLRVADAVSNGSIKLLVGNVPAGAAAAFYAGDRVFRFPDGTYGLNRNDEADMVHESTTAALGPSKASMNPDADYHAPFDLKGLLFCRMYSQARLRVRYVVS